MCHGKEEGEMEGIRPAGIGSRRGALAQDAFGRGRRGVLSWVVGIGTVWHWTGSMKRKIWAWAWAVTAKPEKA
jgi:hypothetical protein